MSDSCQVKIVKLNNTNYSNWKFKMELLLLKQNLWKKVIIGNRPAIVPTSNTNPTPRNAKEIAEWDEAHDQARGSIGLSVEDDQLVHIRTQKTAKDVWNALKDYHEKNTLTNKVHLMRTICSLKLNNGGNVVDHINRMQELFMKLRDIGEDELSENWSVAMLLSSLPREYDSLTTALESRNEEELTFALVQQKVIAEYERRLYAGQSSNTSNDTVLKTITKVIRCFFCKKTGHQKQNCIKYKQWMQKQTNKNEVKTKDTSVKEGPGSSSKVMDKIKSVDEKECEFSEEFLFSAFSIGKVENDDWLLDSGATRHVCNNEHYFETLDLSYKSSIEVANGQFVPVIGIGIIRIKFLDANGIMNIAKATDVLYASKLVGNILSISKLTSMNLKLEFQNTTCSIKYKDRIIGIADCIDKLYFLRKPQKVNVSVEHKSNCIHQWHRTLRHRNQEAIMKMYKERLVENMEIVDCGIKEMCNTCMKGKLTRLPFPKKSFTKSLAPLELIHSDVCSLPVATPNGKEYLVTFIDDFSRFTTISLLRNKSEVEIKLMEFIEFVKTKFERKPKLIRSDRGGEYIGKDVENLLISQGIQIHLTAGYSPQQNGVAERKNRTLVEMARCMLIDAKLPKTFWGEAITTANYIQNRVITRATNVTPYELWNQIKPNMTDIHIFGSKCFVHVPKEKRNKLDDTGIEMIFLGYDGNSKAFCC